MTRWPVRMLRYGGTAGTAALVDVGLFALFQSSGMQLVVAASQSFLVATVVNYVLTAILVFDTKVSFRGYLQFLVAACFGFVLNVGITMLAARVFGFPPVVSKISGVGIAFFANFAVNAVFVFRGIANPVRLRNLRR